MPDRLLLTVSRLPVLLLFEGFRRASHWHPLGRSSAIKFRILLPGQQAAKQVPYLSPMSPPEGMRT